VHFDGGANDLTGERVSSGEKRVHGIRLILEQKEMKETKKIQSLISSSADLPTWLWASQNQRKRPLYSYNVTSVGDDHVIGVE
jgi:hypothetical protein